VKPRHVVCNNIDNCKEPAVQYVIWVGDHSDAESLAACKAHRITSRYWKEISQEDYIVAQVMLK
jgi:hypothetical protein